jgi:hypothetical protein
MTPALVCFHVTAAVGVRARAFLNDLPVFKGLLCGHDSRQGGANHLVVPGENELAIEVLRAPRPRSSGAPPGEPLRFAVFTGEPGSTDVRFLHDVRYAEEVLERGLATEDVPYRYHARFELDVPVNAPLYLSAPVVAVDCDGTPELHRVVRELHATLAGGDADAFFRHMRTHMEEYARAFHGLGDTSVATQQEDLLDLFEAGTEVRDLDPARLHFEARAGGRVVWVTRTDGVPVLDARRGKMRLRSDLWLARVDGRWTVVG